MGQYNNNTTSHNITKGDGNATLNQTAKERNGWRYSGMMSETDTTAEDQRRSI